MSNLSPTSGAEPCAADPHIGLQTVSWLLEGEVMHHDSLGLEARLLAPAFLARPVPR
jgi:redox-sensitive bicupin YhaK (pirin superfamily)